MLDQIISKYCDEFCCVAENEKSIIILLNKYSPFMAYGEGYAMIDSFYFASNILYHNSKKLEVELLMTGFEIVKEFINLKNYAEMGGLGTILNNQLLCNKKYGSYVTLQGIVIKGFYSRIAEDSVKKLCSSCGKCDEACPNAALKSGEFFRENCLRHIQDYPQIKVDAVGRRVLGCGECREICPYNNDIKQIDYSAEILEFLKLENLFKLLSSGASGERKIGEMIGFNYAKSKLTLQVLNALTIREAKSIKFYLEKLEKHQNKLIADHAKRILDIIS